MSANVFWVRRKTSVESPLAAPPVRCVQSNNHHRHSLGTHQQQQSNWYQYYQELVKGVIAEWTCHILVMLMILIWAFNWLIDLAALTRTITYTFLPVIAVINIHFWHVVINRRVINLSHLHSFFCGSVFGEILGCFVDGRRSFLSAGILHNLLVTTSGLFTGLTVGQSFQSSMLFTGTRLLLSVCLPWLEEQPRAVVCYVAGVTGVALAKYVEAVLTKTMTACESRLNRRRRTSNCCGCTFHCLCKTRRTSLPALGGSHRGSHHHASGSHQGSTSGVDVALLAEAHGLVTDMLADPQLPAHVVGGLRSLASLLAPPNHITVNHRLRPGGASVSLADFNSGSDTEEMIPYTGEKPSTLSKRFRRNLPPSLLRRMSTSTWTTTTSATGLPTLEPEPSRKRSTSFRHQGDISQGSPGGAASPREGTTSPQGTSPSRSSSNKGRSYSTTSIPSTASLCRRNSRDRKTVCSLHPLTACDIDALKEAHSKVATSLDVRVGTNADESSAPTEKDDDESRPKSAEQPLPPLPCFRRVNITSDYESSNESPGSSDNNDVILPSSAEDGIRSMPQSLPVQTCLEADLNRCSLCGGRTKHGLSVDEVRSPSTSNQFGQDFEDLTPTAQDGQELEVIQEGPGLLVDGYRFDPDSLVSDPLLSMISEWDYPVFELYDRSEELILSQMCFRVFHEVGLFEAFKIPLQEFLNYFHALETGYRNKPYHNRLHAADVVHGVYYLTSQPVPGFSQISSDATNSPLHKSMEGTASEHGRLVHRPSFAAEVTYGVMGANYPALELMALYAAAAMHDYDHPGRTNAFLVSTYAPQAVLYNDRSVLENHHAASAWNLFLSRPEFNWLCHLDKAEFKRFRFLVIECILATDLKRHFEILAEFNAKVNDDDAPGIDWMSETDRLLVMEMSIKLVDINGPCKRHDLHVQWTARIAEEFYEQGDEEASLGLQVSPFMDRKNPQLAKLQESFINHLVAPLCNAYGEAALLPGVWVESSESDDEEGPGDGEHCESSDGKDTEEELGDSDSSVQNVLKRRRSSQPLRRRKVSCLQTQHLQENYEFWVTILKQEQLEEQIQIQLHGGEEQEEQEQEDEEEEEEEEYDSRESFELTDNGGKSHHQDDMETIEEENGQSRQEVSKSVC